MNNAETLPLLIEPSILNEQLSNPDLLIIDLCKEQSYQEGHIPGAVHIATKMLMGGVAPSPGKLPSQDQLETLFSQAGLQEDTHVVVYDDEGGGWAGRLIWILDTIGHKHYSYLNGGIVAWKAEGLPLQTDSNLPSPGTCNLTIDTTPIVEVEEILANLQNPSFLVWDARSPEEFRGEKVFSQRGGHIPGAVNCEWTQLMDPERGLRIREDAEQYLADLGITKEKMIVTHCQTHHRSGFTYLVGKLLGFTIRAYHGAWSEWGNLPNTPIEQ